MRPTDENQGASTRPNLMSSRRGAGEENILAMLERDSARRSGTRMTSPRLAWYCAAAAFSGILVGVVAWLAYDNHETATAMQVQVQAERVAEEAATVPPPLPDAPHTHASAPALEAPAAPAAPTTAVIVDQPQGMPAAPPPLVMLPPEQAGKAKPAPPPKEMAPLQASTALTPAAAEPVTPAEAKPTKTDKPPALAKADKSDKPAPRAARTAKPARTVAAKASATARTRSKAAPPASVEPAVDTDVALISAIIQYSERHRGERAQPAPCTGPKCPPAPRP